MQLLLPWTEKPHAVIGRQMASTYMREDEENNLDTRGGHLDTCETSDPNTCEPSEAIPTEAGNGRKMTGRRRKEAPQTTQRSGPQTVGQHNYRPPRGSRLGLERRELVPCEGSCPIPSTHGALVWHKTSAASRANATVVPPKQIILGPRPRKSLSQLISAHINKSSRQQGQCCDYGGKS